LLRIHPLELWLLEYLEVHPDATLAEVFDASAKARQESYQWLMKPHKKKAQDLRIRILLEIDAFKRIHESWKRLGFPFDALVPSYATAIGSSGDNPAALAEMAGIILNDGVHYPSTRVQKLRFAEHTPFETIMAPKPARGERVLSFEIAATVKREMIGVVEKGTARRAFGAVQMPDGGRIDIGGKTGTGDNRIQVFARGRRLIREDRLNRTAVFVFFIGDRWFGVVTAFVPGELAGRQTFTSALPVQIFKNLVPSFLPLASPPVVSQSRVSQQPPN